MDRPLSHSVRGEAPCGELWSRVTFAQVPWQPLARQSQSLRCLPRLRARRAESSPCPRLCQRILEPGSSPACAALDVVGSRQKPRPLRVVRRAASPQPSESASSTLDISEPSPAIRQHSYCRRPHNCHLDRWSISVCNRAAPPGRIESLRTHAEVRPAARVPSVRPPHGRKVPAASSQEELPQQHRPLPSSRCRDRCHER